MRVLLLLCAVLVTTVGSSTFAQVSDAEVAGALDDGLVAYYPLNGDATDHSGNGHHGTLHGNTSFGIDRFDNPTGACWFDGDWDYVEVPHDASLNLGAGDFSVCCWVYMNASPVSHGPIVMKRGADAQGSTHGDGYGYAVTIDLQQRPFVNVQYAGTGDTAWGPQLALSRWYFIAGVRDNQDLTLFVNGVPGASVESDKNADNGASLIIGAKIAENDVRWLNGAMDEVRIYNRALTDTEIWDLYLDGGGPFEIMYVYPDLHAYQWGGEEVRIDVMVKSNWGSGNVHLGGNCSCFLCPSWPLDTEHFHLEPGEQHSTTFVTHTPEHPCGLLPCAKEFDIRVSLLDEEYGILATAENDDAFMVTPLSDEQIEYYEQNVEDCWLDADTECIMELASMIPVFGVVPDLELFAEKMCEAGRLNRAGLKNEASAAALMGIGQGSWIFLKSLMGAIGAGGLASVLDITATLARYADECISSELEVAFGNTCSKTQSTASLVDSLALWFQVGIDSTDTDVADVLLLQGLYSVRVEADSSYADAESTGIVFVKILEISDSVTVTTVGPDTRRFSAPEGVNPSSEATFVITSSANQSVDVGLIHQTAAETLACYRYPQRALTDSSTLFLEVSDTETQFPLNIDYDGDGTTDEVLYPQGSAAGVGTSETSGQVDAWLTCSPNPSAGISDVSFYMPQQDRVRIEIYDIQGRKVATLLDGNPGLGEHGITWDHSDSQGMKAAPGIYFLRMESSIETLTRKLILLH